MPSTSAKQARFMRAIAHSPKFAKKAGVPQSVGQHYVTADKAAGRYAGGGKVKKIADLYEKVMGRPGSSFELDRLSRLLDENPGIDKMVEPSTLIKATYGNEPRALMNLDAQEFLGLAAPITDNYKDIFRTEVNKLHKKVNTKNKLNYLPQLQTITSDEPDIHVISHDGRHRAQVLGDRGLKVPTFIDMPGFYGSFADESVPTLADYMANRKLIPESLFDGQHLDPLPVKKRAFADGGFADIFTGLEKLPERNPTRLERNLQGWNNTTVAEAKDHPERGFFNLKGHGRGERHRALLAQGMANMVGTLDEDTGHVGWGLHPGLIDEVTSIPSIFSDNAPKWSQDAKRRTDKLRARIQDQMPNVRAKGLAEHIGLAGGEMLGQVPLPGGAVKGLAGKAPKLLRYMSKAPGALLEYLGPTIHPSPGNYLSGAIAGGMLNSMPDGDPELIQPTDFNNPPDYGDAKMPFPNSPQYAGGGKVSRLRSIMDQVTKDAEYSESTRFSKGHKDRKLVDQLIKEGELTDVGFGDVELSVNMPGKYSPLKKASGGQVLPSLGKLEFGMPYHDDVMGVDYPVRKAEGGKVMRSARAIKSIKDAITHLENNDRSSAIRALSSSDAMTDPHISGILQMLKGPQPGAGGDLLRQAVESDTNMSRVPFMAGGGKVSRLMGALHTMKNIDLDTEIKELTNHPGIAGAIDRRGNIYDPTPEGDFSPRRRFQDLLDEVIRRKKTP